MKNIISCCNAGKREYGEMHWFWAVWIVAEVDDHNMPNDQEPKVSGFAKSKSKARRAAWDALAEMGLHRACFKSWAFQWLFSQKGKDNRPLFSRFSIGKNRWFWVAGNFMEEPIASGFAASPDIALSDAETKVGPVQRDGNSMAQAHWKKQRAIERSKKQASSSTALPLEFVYQCHQWWSDYDKCYHDSISKYRIVKRTKKRIYVESEEYEKSVESSGEWWDWIESTFILDRRVLETTGKATRSSKGWWWNAFYRSPEVYHDECRNKSRPECFDILNLEASATENQIKSAYRRLAKLNHPDNGGDAEEFKRVRKAYEQAMNIGNSIC